MTSVVSKIFCLSNCDDIDAAIRQYTRNHVCDVVPDFELHHLVDDDFIAGFCMKGEVTIVPLRFSYDLYFTVEKSVLSILMSPTVYAGFGLPCVKIKEKPHLICYCFRRNLSVPSFRRNSSVHRRLQRFFSSSSDPVGSLRIPQHVLAPRPCLVHWTPRPQTVHNSLGGFQTFTPLGESLARFLSPETYCKVQTLTETSHFPSPVSVPDFLETSDACVVSLDSEPPTDCSGLKNRINFAKARATYHILSCLSTGILSVADDSSADGVDRKSTFTNPCFSETGLAPLMSMEFREAESAPWSISNATLVRVTGLFICDHVSQLEAIVRRTIETQAVDKRTFAFFAVGLWPSQPSVGNPKALLSKVDGDKPTAKLFLKCPKEETSENDFVVLNFHSD